MKGKQKIFLIVGAVVVLLLVVGLFLRSRVANKNSDANNILEENVIPTVDSSVKVELKPVGKGQVKLTVKNAPEGTRTIEYVLSYDAKDPGSEGGITTQGAIGECKKTGSTRNWECKATNQENIILGTCSSGTCIYHEVVGKAKLELLFRGSYGQRIFDKEYNLNS